MKKISIILFILAATKALQAQPYEKRAMEILQELSEKTKAYPTIKADFTYILQNKEMGINEKKDGTLTLKNNKYILTISGQTIYCDGTTIWTHIEEAKEVHINAVDPDNEDAIDPQKILLTYNDNHRAKLIKEDVENGVAAYFIDLVPKEPKNYYKIRMVVDKAKMQILKSTIFEKEGNEYTYEIKKLVTNQTIADTKFKFDSSKYPGTEVIDMR